MNSLSGVVGRDRRRGGGARAPRGGGGCLPHAGTCFPGATPGLFTSTAAPPLSRVCLGRRPLPFSTTCSPSLHLGSAPPKDGREAGSVRDCSATSSREVVLLLVIRSFNMVSKFTASAGNEGALVTEKQAERSPPNKKIQGKVPKKIHKAEREKLKREHLNELFQELGYALEPARQNNGKASILNDTTRLLRDMLAQVESLRKENAALVTESRYVTVEKNELKDDNLALEAEIEKLKNELREKAQSNPSWRNGVENAVPAVPQPSTTALPLQQPPPVVGPVYVIPLNQELPTELPTYPQDTALTLASPPNPSPLNITRPHARYPTPSDSWPLQILSQQHRTAAQDSLRSGSSSNNNSGNSTPAGYREGSAKE
ncbi:hypothetical protein Taro_011408 [Colocasia esculenta]|uniref:BHLH domain-containing protein n=1 Tax=Colocasia esculenta TaxID=4460 RepID=A0A843U9T1_COLES|nr:hypothetical protein [Colocasia esculenta]